MRKLSILVLAFAFAFGAVVSPAASKPVEAAATNCSHPDSQYHCYNVVGIGGSQKGIYVNFPMASLSISGGGASRINATAWIVLTNGVLLEIGLCRSLTQAPCTQGNANSLVMYATINGSPNVRWSRCCFAANGTNLSMEIYLSSGTTWTFRYANPSTWVVATTYNAGASSSCTSNGCLQIGAELTTPNNMNGAASGTFQMHPMALTTTWNSWTNPPFGHVDYPCDDFPYGSCWQGSWSQGAAGPTHLWTWFFP